MSENNPSEAVGDEGVNAPAPGTENVTPVVSLKDLVKQRTGRDYPTDEEAAKGIEETFKMVGKKVEPQVIEKTIVPENVTAEIEVMKQQLKVSNFYADHPEYKDAKDVIAKFGNDPEQVIKDPTFEKVYGALKTANESGNKATLSSNSRIGMPGTADQTYSQDLKAMRDGQMPVAVFMDKHKGVPMPKEGA